MEVSDFLMLYHFRQLLKQQWIDLIIEWHEVKYFRPQVVARIFAYEGGLGL